MTKTAKSKRVRKVGFKDQNLAQIRTHKYGITAAQYQFLLEQQHGLCALCNNPETQLNKSGTGLRNLSVDHNHVTGVVRGLLCQRCNSGLGMFNDNSRLLSGAALYVEVANTGFSVKAHRAAHAQAAEALIDELKML